VSRSSKQFIWAAIIVLGGAAVVTLCRAQGGGASPQLLYPDLRVYSISAPSTARRGTAISVSDTTTNAGTAPAVLSVSGIYISTSLSNVGSATWVTNHSTSGININSSWPWAGSVTVPAAQPLGTNYYVVVANSNRQVSESNYYNNTNYVMIVITP
jgi:subtilase family serine protease